jgi:uncharacterized cupredoxin-like copper-binding protein
VVAIGALVLLMGAACSSNNTSTSTTATGVGATTTSGAGAGSTLAVTASEPAAGQYKFDLPSSITGGTVNITLKNTGKELHEFQLIRVDGTHTDDEIKNVFSSEGGPTPDFIHATGGAGQAAPGQTSQATVDLDSGSYYFLCFVTDQDNKPHFLSGMFGSAKVAGGTKAAPAAAAGTVTAKDYSFDIAGLKAGSNTVLFKNTSAQQIHHFNAFPLVPGASLDDVKAFLASQGESEAPPPIDFQKGVGVEAVDGGGSEVATVNFAAPGKWVFLCFISDRQGGPPHFVKGMIVEGDVG